MLRLLNGETRISVRIKFVTCFKAQSDNTDHIMMTLMIKTSRRLQAQLMEPDALEVISFVLISMKKSPRPQHATIAEFDQQTRRSPTGIQNTTSSTTLFGTTSMAYRSSLSVNPGSVNRTFESAEYCADLPKSMATLRSQAQVAARNFVTGLRPEWRWVRRRPRK